MYLVDGAAVESRGGQRSVAHREHVNHRKRREELLGLRVHQRGHTLAPARSFQEEAIDIRTICRLCNRRAIGVGEHEEGKGDSINRILRSECTIISFLVT